MDIGQAQIFTRDTTIAVDGSDVQSEAWFRVIWRPACAYIYLIICIFDFIIFPLAMIFLPLLTKEHYIAWNSLTLSNGGLFHLSFGAILGISAWGRSREKLLSQATATISSDDKA